MCKGFCRSNWCVENFQHVLQVRYYLPSYCLIVSTKLYLKNKICIFDKFIDVDSLDMKKEPYF